MPSTAQGGELSRIVPRMASGAAVTVPRTLAHYVITEYGIADLRGCTLRDRARHLIAIAHPKFRGHLADAAGLSSNDMA
jgi:4-hydroxybutyrate CoA-transferase